MSKITIALFLTFLLAVVALAQGPASQPTVWATRPNADAFDKIVNDRLADGQKSIDKIVAVKGSRTIENTLVPYDEAIRQINTGNYLANLMFQVHPDAAFRDRASTMTQKANAVLTALSLNRDVYKALSDLDLSKTDPVTRYYVQRQLLEFRLAGVDKDDATRARLKQLNDDLVGEVTLFERNIADDQRSVDISSAAELDGLPQDYIDRHKPGADGKIKITTDYPDAFPVFKFAKSTDLRKRLYSEFDNRAYPKNRDLLMKMMQTRYEIATLLGYASWADYNAADKMAVNGQHIADFIRDLDAASRPVAEREFAMLLAEKQKADPGATKISEYETSFIREQLRRSKYNFDSQSVRPYLPYPSVKKGIMDTAAQLFHVTFKQEMNVPAWDPTVETWEVIDNGKMVGRFYLDMHPRPGKFSHAEMVQVLDGIRGKQMPEATLVCNFPQPTASDAGLMEYGDVEVFFHEFGHLMHHILGGQQPWAGISGISMEADFGEAPSQMLEEFIRSPQVLASFAHHYKTGEPIPTELVERMNRAGAFGRANSIAAQVSYTALSYDLYKGNPKDVDLDAVTLADTERYTLFTPLSGTHMYASFGHLSGYSSAYYTYMWDKVIALDFFHQFDQKKMLEGETPMRYRKVVLEPGGSVSANDLVKNFLGRPQNMTAFQGWMGEEF
ncbi:MAG: Zn-dependent oligopeptidase [Acidobacteria bacterium]|nr:Zn-dependent oligopeptidase [Acidobacteriota bacterium]